MSAGVKRYAPVVDHDMEPEKAREMHALGKRVRQAFWGSYLQDGDVGDPAALSQLSALLCLAGRSTNTGWQWQEVGQ